MAFAKMPPNSISFIVPCYNEEKNVEDTVTTIRCVVTAEQRDYEIILVNDCSIDRTGEIIDRLAETDQHIKALHNPRNLNMGGAFKRGLRAASKDYLILVPGDNGFGEESLQQVLKAIGGADILIPYVTNSNIRSPLRSFSSKGFTWLINILFGFNIRYYNGPVVHQTALLKTINIRTDSFAYQAESLVKMLAKGYSYKECPVKIQERVGGKSSALKAKNIFAIFFTILDLLLTIGPRRICIRLNPTSLSGNSNHPTG